tara:strand:- start:1064 stop:1486 length:423 start_codon:yes stop_codon:yes gene_type:complete
MTVKVFLPMEHFSFHGHKGFMSDEIILDPFLRRLRRVIDADPDITDAGLAVKAGLDNSAIRRLYSKPDSSPRISTARKICAALGTTLEEFMSEAQTPEEKEIVRLTLALPDHLRQQLLSYAKGLVDASNSLSRPDNAKDR